MEEPNSHFSVFMDFHAQTFQLQKSNVLADRKKTRFFGSGTLHAQEGSIVKYGFFDPWRALFPASPVLGGPHGFMRKAVAW
jgi:hypothetical protein